MIFNKFLSIAALAASALLVACGGGGGGGGGDTTTTTTTTTTSSSCTVATPILSYAGPYRLTVGKAYVGTAIAHTSLSAMPSGCSATVALTSGSLPAGMSLNAATGDITGTPSAIGTAAPKITYVVTDNAGAVVSTIAGLSPTFTVVAAPTTTLTPTFTGTSVITPSGGSIRDTSLFLQDTAGTGSGMNYGRLIENFLYAFSSSTNAYRIALSSVVGGISSNCTTSGTINTKYNDADSSGTVTAGDSWVSTYAACVGSTTTTSVNGTVTYLVNAKAGAVLSTVGGTAWTATVTVTENTTITSANGTTTINRVVPHALTVAADDSMSIAITPTSYAVNYVPKSGSTASTAYTITNATGTVTYAGSIFLNTIYTVSGSFNVSGTESLINSGASYTIAANYSTPLSGLYDSTGTHQAPTSGTFMITGASATSATMSAPFTSYGIDTSGDGVTDMTITFTSGSYADFFTPG